MKLLKKSYEVHVYNHVKDCGSVAKNFEVNGRIACTPLTKITYCKAMNLTDHVIYIDKKRANIEFKLRSGTLDYNKRNQLDLTKHHSDHIPNIYPKAHYIVYAFDYQNGDDVLNTAYVFTRDEFIAFLQGYKGMTKYNRKNATTVLQIQSYQSPKMHKMYEYVEESCIAQPTLGEWLEQVRN